MNNEHQCGGCGSDSGNGCGSKKQKTLTIQVDESSVDCNVLSVFECEEQKYIGLQAKDHDRIYIYKYNEKDDDVVLKDIEEVEELRLVGQILIELLETGNRKL